MRKNKLLIMAIIILSIPLTLFIYLNIAININKIKNERIITKFNDFFSEQTLEVVDDNKFYFSNIEINGTDYIGVINITRYNLLLPVESKCNNYFPNIKAACNYSKDSLVILGTNLSNSFSNFKSYNMEDEITFTNTLGKTFQYKIEKIKRINSLDNLSGHNDDLIIVIKNYYDMEYVLLLCKAY